eukprot:Sspe_Gene.1171::Locus_400_Transcript_1_1_Confidence_1.000_Length_2077::g.1171::m.1171
MRLVVEAWTEAVASSRSCRRIFRVSASPCIFAMTAFSRVTSRSAVSARFCSACRRFKTSWISSSCVLSRSSFAIRMSIRAWSDLALSCSSCSFAVAPRSLAASLSRSWFSASICSRAAVERSFSSSSCLLRAFTSAFSRVTFSSVSRVFDCNSSVTASNSNCSASHFSVADAAAIRASLTCLADSDSFILSRCVKPSFRLSISICRSSQRSFAAFSASRASRSCLVDSNSCAFKRERWDSFRRSISLRSSSQFSKATFSASRASRSRRAISISWFFIRERCESVVASSSCCSCSMRERDNSSSSAAVRASSRASRSIFANSASLPFFSF